MSTEVGWVFLAAALLPWCLVPTTPALAAKPPVRGRGSRNLKVRLSTRMYDLHQCMDKAHSYILKNVTIHLHKDGMEYVDADHELASTARRLMAFRLIIHRCPLGVAGKCEYYNTYSWNMPVCNLLGANGMLWTPVVQNVRPAFQCPLLKGSYEGRNMTVDMHAMSKLIEGLNVDRYSWPFEVQVDSEDGLFVCFRFIGEARRVRVKEN